MLFLHDIMDWTVGLLFYYRNTEHREPAQGARYKAQRAKHKA